MQTNQNKSAQSRTYATVLEVLEVIQRMYIPDYNFLICEDWDWLVVLQCMQAHGLYKSNPKRPPLKDFVEWLRSNSVPQYLAHYSVYEMSLASRNIRGARFPWAGVMWEPHVLKRWRHLYRKLDKMLTDLEATKS